MGIRTEEQKRKHREYMRKYNSIPKNKIKKELLDKKYKINNRAKIAVLANKHYNKKKKEYYARMTARKKIVIPLGEKCELCKINLAKERHHPDYDQPLEIMFLCVKCHAELHSKWKKK